MQRSAGAIGGEDGYRYDFNANEWRSDDPPARGMVVDFSVAENGRDALDVYPSVESNSVHHRDHERTRSAQAHAQEQISQPQHPPLPDNYLVWSIVVTALCCLPTGIVAIVYSAKVNGLHRNGQYQDAKDAAKTAKSWIYGSVALGIGIGILVFLGSLNQGY